MLVIGNIVPNIISLLGVALAILLFIVNPADLTSKSLTALYIFIGASTGGIFGTAFGAVGGSLFAAVGGGFLSLVAALIVGAAVYGGLGLLFQTDQWFSETTSVVISQRSIDFDATFEVLIRVLLMIISFFGFLAVVFTVVSSLVGFYGATLIGCAFARCDTFLSTSISALTISSAAYLFQIGVSFAVRFGGTYLLEN